MPYLVSRVGTFARKKCRDENGNIIDLYPAHNDGRYTRDAFTDICANCYLPACYADDDFEDVKQRMLRLKPSIVPSF